MRLVIPPWGLHLSPQVKNNIPPVLLQNNPHHTSYVYSWIVRKLQRCCKEAMKCTWNLTPPNSFVVLCRFEIGTERTTGLVYITYHDCKLTHCSCYRTLFAKRLICDAPKCPSSNVPMIQTPRVRLLNVRNETQQNRFNPKKPLLQGSLFAGVIIP